MCNTEANVNLKSIVLEVLSGKGEAMRIPLDINEEETENKEFLLY